MGKMSAPMRRAAPVTLPQDEYQPLDFDEPDYSLPTMTAAYLMIHEHISDANSADTVAEYH